MKFLKLEFIYKKHDTLHYVTLLYTKIHTFRKNQDNLRSIFIYKNTHNFLYAIFHGIFEIVIGGGGGCMQKKMHFALHLYTQKQCTLRYVFIKNTPDTLQYIFIYIYKCTLCYLYIYNLSFSTDT